MLKQQIHKFKLILEFDLKLKGKEKLSKKSLSDFVSELRNFCYGCYDLDSYAFHRKTFSWGTIDSPMA